MAEFAQFVAVGDDPFELPSTEGRNEELFHFSLADLDATRTVVVFFKVNARGRARLLMRVNGHSQHFIDRVFESSATEATITRSWHEVFPGTEVNAEDNELIVSISPDSEGSVRVSDIVFLYHARG